MVYRYFCATSSVASSISAGSLIATLVHASRCVLHWTTIAHPHLAVLVWAVTYSSTTTSSWSSHCSKKSGCAVLSSRTPAIRGTWRASTAHCPQVRATLRRTPVHRVSSTRLRVYAQATVLACVGSLRWVHCASSGVFPSHRCPTKKSGARPSLRLATSSESEAWLGSLLTRFSNDLKLRV